MSYDPGAQAEASARHAAAVHDHLEAEVLLANEAVSILVELLDRARTTPFDDEANTLAAWLCFRRALEEIRLAHFAALFGHYSEVPLLVRGAYEAAGLARMLALEEDDADKWIHDPPWQKDATVRKWIKERGGDEEAYAEYCAKACDAAHPKFGSMLPFFSELDRSVPMCAHGFDREQARTCLIGTASGALFAIHCFRNATAPGMEDMLPPELRQRVVALHAEMGGDVGHLDQDWDAMAARRERLAQRIERAAGLEGRIDGTPLSARNLNRNAD